MSGRRRIGIYCPSLSPNGGEEKASAVVAERLARFHDVILFARDDSLLSRAPRFFDVDLSGVRLVPLGDPGLIASLILRQGGEAAWRALLFEGPRHARAVEREMPMDVFINCLGASHLRNRCRLGVYRCMFPPRPPEIRSEREGMARRIARRLMKRWRDEFDVSLSSYTTLAANSQFTASWVREFLGRDAEIVYSAASDMGPAAAKEKLILHVGNFGFRRDGTHYKGQDFLIDTFRSLKELHEAGWRLGLAGNIQLRSGGGKALDRLRRAAAGFPVEFHPDLEISELRQLYRRASIYWHATAIGLDSRTNPSVQEHFGCTVVEAMSAGAVPVVYAEGGPAETVVDGKTGFHFCEAAELSARTIQLARDSKALCEASARAVERARSFSISEYARRMESLIDRLVDNRAAI